MDLITIIAGTIVTVGGFLVGIFTGKKLRAAEAREKEAQARTIELGNIAAEVDIYKEMIQDQKAHNAELRVMNHDLMNTVQPLRDRVSHLEEIVDRLQKENAALKSK